MSESPQPPTVIPLPHPTETINFDPRERVYIEKIVELARQTATPEMLRIPGIDSHAWIVANGNVEKIELPRQAHAHIMTDIYDFARLAADAGSKSRIWISRQRVVLVFNQYQRDHAYMEMNGMDIATVRKTLHDYRDGMLGPRIFNGTPWPWNDHAQESVRPYEALQYRRQSRPRNQHREEDTLCKEPRKLSSQGRPDRAATPSPISTTSPRRTVLPKLGNSLNLSPLKNTTHLIR